MIKDSQENLKLFTVSKINLSQNDNILPLRHQVTKVHQKFIIVYPDLVILGDLVSWWHFFLCKKQLRISVNPEDFVSLY
jgi:hypothetical protein